jgi:hypothetical protein
MRAIPGLDPKAPVMTGAIPSDCDAHDVRPYMTEKAITLNVMR